jgi:hypothetical protein
MKYTEEALRSAATNAKSIREVIRIITGNDKPSGGTANHVSFMLKTYGIDTSHFTGQGHGNGASFERKSASEILIRLSPGQTRTRGSLLTRAMIETGKPYICFYGHAPKWNGKDLVLQVDHIDGDWYNNSIENLRFLCPNCHTQTETWGFKKRG